MRRWRHQANFELGRVGQFALKSYGKVVEVFVSGGAPRDISTLYGLSRPSRINPTISCVEMFKLMPATSSAERLDSSGLRIKVFNQLQRSFFNEFRLASIIVN